MPGGSGSDVDPVREVNRLHLVLEDWYGKIRGDIDPIENALAADFTWIDPDGDVADRSASVAAWRERRQSYTAAATPVSIDLEDVTFQRSIYGVHQMTYTKHVTVDGETRSFTCSLWLRETERAPSGLQWLHLTETRIAESEEDNET